MGILIILYKLVSDISLLLGCFDLFSIVQGSVFFHMNRDAK